MSFIQKFKKGMKGAKQAINTTEYQVLGTDAKCIHCGHKQFGRDRVQLHTAGTTILNAKWADDTVSILICKKCSYIMWFASDPQKLT